MSKEEKKVKLCDGEDCYKEIDLREFPIGDVFYKTDGAPHPLSLLCEDCITTEQRKTLKNWRKRQRQKANHLTH